MFVKQLNLNEINLDEIRPVDYGEYPQFNEKVYWFETPLNWLSDHERSLYPNAVCATVMVTVHNCSNVHPQYWSEISPTIQDENGFTDVDYKEFNEWNEYEDSQMEKLVKAILDNAY